LQQQKCFNALEKIFYKLNNYFSNNWRLAVLDINAGRWTVNVDLSSIAYLKAENANGRHILMQPVNEEYYMLADDLNFRLLQQHHKNCDGSWKTGRMIIETSPDNYQVWIRSSRPLSLDEKSFWLKRMHSDPGASPLNRWGRMPGFRNRKEKYRSNRNFYPLAKLIWVDWKYKASVPRPYCKKTTNTSAHLKIKTFAQKQIEICRKDYEKGNESITDFSYALALARRGYDARIIESRIISERQNWDNHMGDKRIRDYLNRTITKAMNIITAS
jgi:hypothetical protein